MPKTVEEGFRVFLRRLTPSETESQAAKRHRASIEACLKKKYGLKRFFRTGSFGNGTSIRGYSDVDYFYSMPGEAMKLNSKITLRAVRYTLNARFPDTGVAIRSPAVLVPFGKNKAEWTDVVPAGYIGKTKGSHSTYAIADGTGGWTQASPEAHNSYVARIDDRLDKKIKPLVRFLKAWKYYCYAPISSFYIELRAAKYASTEDSIIYTIDIMRILRLLWDKQLAAIQDPMGISGYIYPCATDVLKQRALKKLRLAMLRAQRAWEAEQEGNIREAFRLWKMVYNGKFASYF